MWLPSTSASAQDDDLVVADLRDVELVADAGADGRDQRLDLGVLEHLVDAGPLDVEDLAPDGQDRLVLRVAGVHGRAAGRVALDDEELALAGSLRAAVLQLVGHARALERGLAPGGVAGLTRRDAGPRRLHRLLDDACCASAGCSSSQSASFSLVARSTSDRMETLPSLALVWPSNCGSRSFTRDDRGEALTDVLALEVVVLLLEEALAACVLVHHVGEGLLEALLVHAALDGGDAVGEGVEAVGVEAGVPLEARSRPPGRSSACSK